MEDAQYMLHKWQVGHFDSNNPEKTPSERADAVIGTMSQVCLAKAASRIPSVPWSDLMNSLMRNYSATVDCSTERGVNNYAEGALAVAGHYAVDSSQWKSSLKEDQIRNSGDYLKLLKTSQQKHAQLKEEVARCFSGLEDVSMEQSLGRPTTGDGTAKQRIPQPDDKLNNNHLPQNMNVQLGPRGRNSETTNPASFSDDMKPMEWDENIQLQKQRGLQPPSGIGHGVSYPQTDNRNGKRSAATGNFNWAQGQQDRCFNRNRSSVGGSGPSGYDVQIRGREDGGHSPESGTMFGRSGPQGCGFQRLGQTNDGWGSKAIPGQRSSYGSDVAGDPRFNLPRAMAGESIWQNQPMKRKKPSTEDLQSKLPLGPDEAMVEGPPDKAGPSSSFGNFKTARQQLTINNQQNNSRGRAPTTSAYGTGRKVLGVTRKGRGLNSKFVPPVMTDDAETNQRYAPQSSSRSGSTTQSSPPEEVDERLQGIDPKMVDLIMKEIMDHGPPISWEDIAGLEYAKKTIREIVVWPMLRPDIFHGLRGPPKGLLLFGPPGTGKTLIGKCIASQSKSTFFSISASSLTSKWVGEGEKMVRALFTVARCHQPAVIFIDEIDSLLSQRSTDEHESSRRIKTEFLIQLDGATSSDDDRLLVVGATNRPQEIDEAARRRLVKRLYIPLPDLGARRQIILNLLSGQGNYSLNDEEVALICERTDGYSGADVANLCREAALGPIRSLDSGNIQHVSAEEVRPISYEDFVQAVEHVKPSVSSRDLEIYLQWNHTYGSGKT